MTEYELEKAAYEKGFKEGVEAERKRIMDIAKDEVLSDYENPPWNVFLWGRFSKRVLGG